METDRILLRPWLESDAPALFKYASDQEVGPLNQASAKPGESLSYYRKNGVHFVPKLGIEDLLV